jgi:hypothetical protein
MPLFMDVYETLPAEATARDVAAAHRADLDVQQPYGVQYLRYWVDGRQARCSTSLRRPAPKPRQRSTARPTGCWQTGPTRSSRASSRRRRSRWAGFNRVPGL